MFVWSWSFSPTLLWHTLPLTHTLLCLYPLLSPSRATITSLSTSGTKSTVCIWYALQYICFVYLLIPRDCLSSSILSSSFSSSIWNLLSIFFFQIYFLGISGMSSSYVALQCTSWCLLVLTCPNQSIFFFSDAVARIVHHCASAVLCWLFCIFVILCRHLLIETCTWLTWRPHWVRVSSHRTWISLLCFVWWCVCHFNYLYFHNLPVSLKIDLAFPSQAVSYINAMLQCNLVVSNCSPPLPPIDSIWAMMFVWK